MKRLVLMLVLLAVSLAVLAHSNVKPKSFEFAREGKSAIIVVIGYDGSLIVYEDDQMVGRHENGCEPQ